MEWRGNFHGSWTIAETMFISIKISFWKKDKNMMHYRFTFNTTTSFAANYVKLRMKVYWNGYKLQEILTYIFKIKWKMACVFYSGRKTYTRLKRICHSLVLMASISQSKAELKIIPSSSSIKPLAIIWKISSNGHQNLKSLDTHVQQYIFSVVSVNAYLC